MTRTVKEFETMMDEVADNLKIAHFHIKLYRQLIRELNLSENLAKYNDSPIFWNATLYAHYNVGILSLTKVYDSHKDSISITKIINVIKSCHSCWDGTSLTDKQIKKLDEDISHITPTNTEKELTTEPNRVLTTSKINEETGELIPALSPVDKLINIRNRKLSHSGKQSVLIYNKTLASEKQKRQDLERGISNDFDFAASISYEFFKESMETTISLDEVIQLINEGIEIINRYRAIFNMPEITTNVDGEDDYKKIFELPEHQ